MAIKRPFLSLAVASSLSLTFASGSVRAQDCGSAQRAVVSVPVASVYEGPNDSAARVTQALFCSPLLCLEQKGDWVKVVVLNQYRTEEGYPGWILANHISYDYNLGGFWSDEDIEALGLSDGTWESEHSYVIVEPRLPLYSSPQNTSPVIMYLYAATVVAAEPVNSQWLSVVLPDGQGRGYISANSAAVCGLEDSGQAIAASVAKFSGVPYLWGGLTCQGCDCSGFIYVIYRMHGFLLPRDADQQFLTGDPVEEEDLQLGDLLFYGDSQGNIIHVGIYLDDGLMVDASGRFGLSTRRMFVGNNSHYMGARRVLTCSEE